MAAAAVGGSGWGVGHRYGTSILQGAVASRPGQMHTHITSRGVETEIFNFGFSGNGIMELSVAQYFVDIDASLIIIDCNPNMNATGIVRVHRALTRVHAGVLSLAFIASCSISPTLPPPAVPRQPPSRNHS